MTTDERLDRLVERHEALTQSVELLAIETRELRAAVSELTASMSGLQAAVAADGEHIRALARIAEIHERRITRLEGGGEDGA
jgi:prefoldin subunit 5